MTACNSFCNEGTLPFALCPFPDDKAVLQNLKRILAKVQEMRDQRLSLEHQLRELIQKDDITTSLVTTDRSEMKVTPGGLLTPLDENVGKAVYGD